MTLTDFFLYQNRPQFQRVMAMLGDVRTLTLDFRVWADDNGTVTTCTWSVVSGGASVAAGSVTGSVATTTVTCSQAGTSLLKALVTNGQQSLAVYLVVSTKDPGAASDFASCVAYF